MNFTFCKILLLILCCLAFLGCVEQLPKTERVIIVKVMPLPVWDDAPEELFYWEKQKFLFPQIEVPDPLPQGIPNDDSLLVVSVGGNGKIKLNGEETADLSSIELLQTRLETVFRQREENKVFEPNSNRIVKIIALRANISLKYCDVIKVIDAIKTSGADPIILQIDDPPE